MGLSGTQPKFRITANSVGITSKIQDRFISMRLTDEAGFESDSLELILADNDPANPIEIPATGAELEVFLGYDAATYRMGLYVCDEVELTGWPGEMSIRARSAIYEKTPNGKTDLQTQKTRAWPRNTKLGDLVAKIAQEHGMQPAVSESLKGIVLPQFDQTDESDLSFLVRVARRYDAVMKPSGGKLVMAKRGESKTISGDPLPTIVLVAGDVSRFRMLKATKDSPGTVKAYWNNKRSARRVEVKVGDGEPVKHLRHTYPDADAAKKAAEAELERRKRGEMTLSLSIPGNPEVAAECRLVLSGFRAGVDGQWLITRAEHTLDAATGYVTNIEAEKPTDTDEEG